ncbi:MAG: prepilin-type N-terminal cleavage/methylation domain-containing protein [Pseudomonadota bacterium]
MVKLPQSDRSKEQGFTLVELAVVMIIIGLLIGGILKGQELIANAEVAATISQIQSFDGAVSSFDDKYDGLPGDLVAPNNRLPNCGAAPCAPAAGTPGNGNLDVLPNAAMTNEALAFFIHLSRANFITGIDDSGGAATAAQFGNAIPEAQLGGGWQVGSTAGGGLADFANTIGTAIPSEGVYLAHVDLPGAPATANAGMTPNQAQRIDTKLDDGNGSSGTVRAYGTAGTGAAACFDLGNDVYIEANETNTCGVYVRVQN